MLVMSPGITHQASERAGQSSGPGIAPAPADNTIPWAGTRTLFCQDFLKFCPFCQLSEIILMNGSTEVTLNFQKQTKQKETSLDIVWGSL